jgi:hypothetical protein
MSTPELGALQDLCARLERAGIAYMLTGSLAMSYYARPRMTRDIDVVVALDAATAGTLADVLGKDYHVDAGLIAEGFRLRRPCNVLHLPTVVKIDLIPRKDSEYRRAEFERRRKVNFAGVELWIASPEDLVLSKLEWARDSGSELQMRDVRQLLEAPLDTEYLALWAGRLRLQSLLKEAYDD